MARRLVRLAVAGSVLVCCADLSGLQGKDADPGGADGSAEGAAQAGDADSSPDGTAATFPRVSCVDAGPDVVYCATFDPNTPLNAWGAPDTTDSGELSIDTMNGVSDPGALLAKVSVHDAAAGYVKARMRQSLDPSPVHFRVSFSMRVSSISNDENLVSLDFGAYELTFQLKGGATALQPDFRETEPADGSYVYSYQNLAYAQDHDTWQRYVLDLYRSESGGSASHIEIRVAGKVFSLPLRVHLYPPTKLELRYGFVASDETKIDETALFDDVVVEAL